MLVVRDAERCPVGRSRVVVQQSHTPAERQLTDSTRVDMRAPVGSAAAQPSAVVGDGCHPVQEKMRLLGNQDLDSAMPFLGSWRANTPSPASCAWGSSRHSIGGRVQLRVRRLRLACPLVRPHAF